MDTKGIVQIMLDELCERGLIKQQKRSAFSSTELLLYHYNDLKRSIDENKSEIAHLRENGWPKRSASVVGQDHIDGGESKDEFILLEERISHLEQSNVRTEAILQKLNRLIKDFALSRYPDLIQRLYFDGKTREECAEIYQCDVATISRNKSRIINNIKAVLFPNEIINELGC